MRDLPASRDLLALARELLLEELTSLLPRERWRDAHLIATVMAMTEREAKEEGWQEEIAALLEGFYGNGDAVLTAEAAPTPTLPRLRGRESGADTPSPVSGGGSGWGFDGGGEPIERLELLARLAADLRNGAFETSPSRAAASRAILWRLTIEKLREANPQFLVANGFRNAGRQST